MLRAWLGKPENPEYPEYPENPEKPENPENPAAAPKKHTIIEKNKTKTQYETTSA